MTASIKDFTLNLEDLEFFGSDLSRPECVIAQPDGTFYISDTRGGITKMLPDGSTSLVPAPLTEPNGIAIDSKGNFYIADLADHKIVKLHPDGTSEVILDSFNGEKLGPANFVWVDSRDRLWIAIMTTLPHWFQGAANPRPDGYVLLMDENGVRKVADGIVMTNEIRLDAEEKYLYVAETMLGRISRFPVLDADGNLGERETFGPESLAFGGYVDGFTFDADGNIWVTTVLRNGVMIITPDGEAHTVFEDPNEEGLAAAKAAVENGTLTPELMGGCVGATLQFPTSIVFAGEDRKDVYLGSLAMPHLVKFRSPVAGAPMRHW